MSEINWKSKYEALKAKYLEDLDMAFRLGHEQGQQEAMMDSIAQQQQQQADEMAAQNNGMGDGQDQGQEGEEVPSDNQEPPVSANPQGSELDKHINELESMLKSEDLKTEDLGKIVLQLKNARSKMAQEVELRKSAQAISGIAAALHKPKFKVSQQAKHNLSTSAKKAVNMQQEIVESLMKTWAEEEKRASKDILNQLGVEGIVKR